MARASKKKTKATKATKGTQGPLQPTVQTSAPEESLSAIYELFLGEDVVIDYMDATDKISEARQQGKKEVSLPLEFLEKWIHQTFRLDDPETAEAWNRSCDSAGMPHHKVPVPGARDAEAPIGPLTLQKAIQVHGPLKLRKRARDTDDSGGPF